ncbi:MAG: hypothetical protein FD137_1452 [Spirochaetes bacterium]|nr:MAG: hypothetical protein FD137_1452 [Spirochaetota bacterium]
MTFSVLQGEYAIRRYPSEAALMPNLSAFEFACVSKSPGEATYICPADALAPEGWQAKEKGWRILKIKGPFSFEVVGVLAQASAILAAAGVSIFAVSTFDTDYLLVKEKSLAEACDALKKGGHEVSR